MRTSALRQRPSFTSSARRRLLVVESGAPVLSGDGAEAFDETVAVAQVEGEPPVDFADRVLHRIASAERSAHRFEVVTLFTSTSTDAAFGAARRLIALATAAHAQSCSPQCELTVVASPTAPAELRARLLELADELVLSADRDPLPVRVCFNEPAPRRTPSGVFRRPAHVVRR